MARVDSFNHSDMKGIAKEHFRDAKKYKNYVDGKKSHLNYHMNTDLQNTDDFMRATTRRVNEIMDGREVQKHTNVISEWVISCPQELLEGVEHPEDSAEVRQFFQLTYDFCKARYGSQNVIDGFVHMDETTPHIHICVVPEATSRKTGRKTVSSASFLPPKELRGFHTDLDRECERKFHKSKLIRNGKTVGNQNLEQWKNQQARDAARDKEMAEQVNSYRQFLSSIHFQNGKSALEVYDEKHKPVFEEKTMDISHEKQPEGKPSDVQKPPEARTRTPAKSVNTDRRVVSKPVREDPFKGMRENINKSNMADLASELGV